MKKYIKTSTNRTSRSDLIDYIDDVYNTQEGWTKLNPIMLEMLGDYNAEIDDSDPDEGMFALFSTPQLEEILNRLESNEDRRITIKLTLTQTQLDVLRDSLKTMSNVQFSRDSDVSREAKKILSQLSE